jgi:hypothetical protein
VDLVGQVRAATLPHLPDFEDRSRRWKAALDLDELEHLIRVGHGALAATRLRDRLLEGRRAPLPGGLRSPTGGPGTGSGGSGAGPGGTGTGPGGSGGGLGGTGAGRPGPRGAS